MHEKIFTKKRCMRRFVRKWRVNNTYSMETICYFHIKIFVHHRQVDNAIKNQLLFFLVAINCHRWSNSCRSSRHSSQVTFYLFLFCGKQTWFKYDLVVEIDIIETILHIFDWLLAWNPRKLNLLHHIIMIFSI